MARVAGVSDDPPHTSPGVDALEGQNMYLQPDLMKIRIILRQIKTKTRGIDTQKWTLACLCYAMGRVRVVV